MFPSFADIRETTRPRPEWINQLNKPQPYWSKYGITKRRTVQTKLPFMKRRNPYVTGEKRFPKRQKAVGVYVPRLQTVARSRGIYGQPGENKYFDSAMDFTIPASTGWTATEADPTAFPVASINCLFAPTQGAAINQRIGREVKVKKIRIKGYMFAAAQANQSVADNMPLVRLSLVLDKESNATQIQGEQIFDVGSTTSYITAFQNLDTTGRIQMLKDKFYNIEVPSITWDSTGNNIEQTGASKFFKMTHTFKTPLTVRFNAANGGTIADIVNNSFHLIANSSNADLTLHVGYKCRVVYCE